MQGLSKSRRLKDIHKGATFLVAGCAPSLGDIDLYLPPEIVTIGPNRILNHPYFVPNYVMLCDRLPYSIDYKMGIYHQHVGDVTYLASTTLWDPGIKCRGFPVVPKPDFPFYPWRVGAMSTKINITTFEEPLCSFGTIAGPMIQAAVIMGAKKIGVVGVDLEAPKSGNCHFYKDGSGEERMISRGDISGDKISIVPRGCVNRLTELKALLSDNGVEITNLSPVKDSPFSWVCPAKDFDEWVANA